MKNPKEFIVAFKVDWKSFFEKRKINSEENYAGKGVGGKQHGTWPTPVMNNKTLEV